MRVAANKPPTNNATAGVIPAYWDDVFRKELYPNLFFYQYGKTCNIASDGVIRIARPFKELADLGKQCEEAEAHDG